MNGISGHNFRNRPKNQQGANGNQQKLQMKPNAKPQKAKFTADSQQSAIMHGIDKLSQEFQKEMGKMSSRISSMEKKNESVLQQNKALAENVEKHVKSASEWEEAARGCWLRHQEILQEVKEKIEANNALRKQNDELKKKNIALDKRISILIARNKMFEDGIKVLITEHADLKSDLMALAGKSGYAAEFQSIVTDDGYDEDEERARDRREHIKAMMVFAHVASRMTQ